MEFNTAILTPLVTLGLAVIGCGVWLVRLEGRINAIDKDTMSHSRYLDDKNTRLMTLERKDASDTEILKDIRSDVGEMKEFFTHHGLQALRNGIVADLKVFMVKG